MRLQIYQPFSFLQVGWRHRALISRLAWRKIEARYRGSVLGLLWALIHPLLMLGIYTFVFGVVFRARWSRSGGSEVEFALFLFSGLILYAIFAECVNEAPGLMAANQTYIKLSIFPVEILAWVSLLASLMSFVVSLLLLIAFQCFVMGPPPLTSLYLPLVMVPLLMLTLGAVWFVSSLGVFLRDISQVVGVATTALLFMSPVFYSPSRIPEPFRPYYDLNPLARLLEASKESLFHGLAPDWVALAMLTVGAWLVAWLGYAWFMRTKGSFADVL